MAKNKRDLFAAQYKPVNREANTAAIEEYIQNGGKVIKVVDSKRADEIRAEREKIMKTQKKSSELIVKRFLFKDSEVLTRHE